MSTWKPGLPPIEQVSSILLRVKRELVEADEVRPIVTCLEKLTASPQAVLKLRHRITLTMLEFESDDAWTSDPKAANLIWRLYCQWPYWFFYADRRSRTLANLFYCALTAANSTDPESLQKRIDEFFLQGFAALKHLATQCGMNQHQIERMLNIAAADTDGMNTYERFMIVNEHSIIARWAPLEDLAPQTFH